MGQGNAIAHLMPPPFYAYRMVVAKARAPESSIQDQIDQIHDATAINRYKVEVMPGIYPEVITMKQYVDVCAPYGRVLIQPASGTAGVTMQADCMLQGIQVDQTNQGASATGIVIGDRTNVVIEDCWVTGGGAGDIAISDATTASSAAAPVVRRCRVDSAETSYQKTGTGTTYVMDNRFTAGTGGVEVDVNAGTLFLLDNELMNTAAAANVDVAAATITINSYNNILSGTTGWNIADDGNAWVYSHNDTFLSVTHAGAGHMVATEEPLTYRVNNGMKIGDAISAINTLADASDTNRYLIKLFSGEYNEAITMDQYVDLVGESNQSCVIYQTGATVITAANNSRIRSVRVEMTSGAGHMGIACNDGIAGIVEDVIVRVTSPASGYNYAIYTTDTGGVVVYGSNFYASGAQTFAGTFAGTGTHKIYDSIFESADTFDIWVSINGVVDSYNNKLLGNGWQIDDYANVDVRSYGDDFAAVTFQGTAGLFADLTGCRLYTCASGLTIGDWVYVSDNDTVAEADADALATMPSVGVINYKPSDTTCYVKQYGYYYDANTNTGHGDAFVAGEEYWISATPGEITTTMHPVWPQRAGVAASTQRFKILIGDNLGLVHCNEYLCATGTIVADQWVYMTAADDIVGLADSDAAGTMQAVGVCVAVLVVGDPNDTILVKLRGKNSVSDTTVVWVPSDDVYISATAGAITNVIPGGIIQKVAEVKNFSTPTLIYEIAD